MLLRLAKLKLIECIDTGKITYFTPAFIEKFLTTSVFRDDPRLAGFEEGRQSAIALRRANKKKRQSGELAKPRPRSRKPTARDDTG
jgi:hypothetical protein